MKKTKYAKVKEFDLVYVTGHGIIKNELVDSVPEKAAMLFVEEEEAPIKDLGSILMDQPIPSVAVPVTVPESGRTAAKPAKLPKMKKMQRSAQKVAEVPKVDPLTQQDPTNK